jgi:ankyrin repeat protein
MDHHLCDSLHSASIRGHNECLKRLLNDGVNVNEKNNQEWTPLHCASRKGHNECIITLLNAGAYFNDKDNHECTPLHYASMNGYKECVISLLSVAETSANINDKDKYGCTPLHYASGYGYECIITLLNAGANPDEKNNNGKTPFDISPDKIKEVIKRWIEDNEIPIKEPCIN